MKNFFLSYLSIKKRPYLIFITILWIIALFVMNSLFTDKSENIYQTVSINASDNEMTPLLYPYDTIAQTFVLSENSLSSIEGAFSYDAAMLKDTTLSVQIFHDDTLIVDQPLPLMACPSDTFLSFYTPLIDCKGDNLTVCITNTSSDQNAAFTLLSTTRFYTYQDYTKKYFYNDEPQSGSILCRFNYITGKNYYPGATHAFFVFIFTLIISGLIVRGYSWLQQHKSH